MLLLGLFGLYLLTGGYHLHKPLPDGLDTVTPYRQVEQVEFLADTTWLDPRGRQHTEHEIFDAAVELLGEAQSLIVADFFLLNRFAGDVEGGHRPLSTEFVDGWWSAAQRDPR